MIDLYISTAKTKEGSILSKLGFLYIEVFFNNISSNKRYFMQVDTGANMSIIYYDKLKLIDLNRDESNISLCDVNAEKKEFKSIETAIKFSIEGKYTIKRFFIEEDVSENEDVISDFEFSNNVVGSIGMDLIQKKLILDFKNQKIYIDTSPPTKYLKKLSENKLFYTHLKIPFIKVYLKSINKDIITLYDSAAGTFDFITSKEIYDIYELEKEKNYNVSRIDIILKVYSKHIEEELVLNKKSKISYAIKNISTVKDDYLEKIFKEHNFNGIISSNFFENEIVEIDFENSFFKVFG